MTRILRLLVANLVFVGATSAAWAQGATNVVIVTPDSGATQVQVGEYYTQALLKVNGFSIPSDDNGRKQLGKAILSAFGLGDKTKSLTISAVLSHGGQNLPEIPLVSYTFDGNKRVTNYEVNNAYLSPRWQLGGADTVAVTLNYRFSEQTTYSPTTVTDSVKQLIPSDAIVSTRAATLRLEVERVPAQPAQFGNAQACLKQEHDDRVVATA